MKYVNLGGGTGLRVSRARLGMMSFGTSTERPWAVDEEAAEPIVRAARCHGSISSPGGRRAVAWVVWATPSCSSI
jgi:hypothetical protein